MRQPEASVIIPTHNRHEILAETLACLQRQSLPRAAYEILVMDDGSTPPVTVPNDSLNCRVVRLEGVERSAARNTGARLAQGKILLFLDDDIQVKEDFLALHLQAHAEWPEALVVGAIYLPTETLQTPFGMFRHQLEQDAVPQKRGLVEMPNFCTAANMSINRDRYFELGGFNNALRSAEDQELALRHTARGSKIIYLPEADTIHRDHSLDIRSYCQRVEWGSEHVIPFCNLWPNWPQNIERQRVNGPLRIGREAFALSLRKISKTILGQKTIVNSLFGVTSLLERLAPGSFLLRRFYQLLLGIHLQRGYRKGLKRVGKQLPTLERGAEILVNKFE